MQAALPQGHTVRAPHKDELEAVVALIRASERADLGEELASAQEMGTRWDVPESPLATNAWVAVAPDGALAGFARVRLGESNGLFLNVHPRQRNRGIGSALLDRVETRAQAHLAALHERGAASSLLLRTWMTEQGERARRFAERRGYRLVRIFNDMDMALSEAAPSPSWPGSIRLEPFERERDARPLYDAMSEAFADHWGGMNPAYEQWLRMSEREDFDSSLWYVAWEEGAIAGAALCSVRGASGWVDELFVRRPWRKHGLGLALLRHACGQCYARGFPRVGLSVDSENPTGAVRLYERAGMSVIRSIRTFEQTLNALASRERKVYESGS
jgi:mycothiol synthase